MTQNNSPKANGWRSVGQVYTWSNAERSCWTQMLHICLLIRLILHGLTMTLIYPTQTGTVPRQVVTSDPVLYAPIPRDVSTSCYRLASSFGSLTPSSECTSVYPLGALGGGGAAAGVVVCYMDSLSEPTESSVPVKESSWGHCGRTPVTHETRGAPRIMHKRDCFCHENVGFGPDVRMILLLLFF